MRRKKKLPHYVLEFSVMSGLSKKESMMALRNQVQAGLGAGQFYKITPKGRRMRVGFG